MATQIEGPSKAFKAGEALAVYRLVRQSADETVSYCDAGDIPVGVTQDASAINLSVEVRLLNAQGTHKVTAAGAITSGDLIYAAADGKVNDVELGEPIGMALDTASGDGSVIEALLIPGLFRDAIVVTGGAGGITAGDLVYVSDQTDGVMTVLPAQGTSAGYFAAYICPSAIAAAATGVAIPRYLWSAIDTSTASALGSPVYLSDGTAGGYTFTKPTGTDKVQIVGRVAEKHATTGAILFDLPGAQQIVHTHADNSEGGLVPATSVTVADAGSLITATTTEAALAEAFQHIQSAQAFIDLPMGAFTLDDGTALADFADGASATPGWSAGDKSAGIRWNNHATPTPVAQSISYPPDLNPAANVIVHFLAAKVGATLADAVTWTVQAYECLDGALYDADADFGGASSAMTGDAATKTCQEETLTLALANITGSPGTLTLTVQPTDGTLGTDDVILLGVWLEYTRKTLTS